MMLHTYNYLPLTVHKANGSYLHTESGDIFFDTFSGLGVNLLGFSDPELNMVLAETAKRYLHLSNYFLSPETERLASKLTALTGAGGVFFANSGAEAIEAALKIVRKHWGGKRKKIFTMEGNFHGRTMGALSLCTRKRIRDSFEPLYPAEIIPLSKFEALDSLLGSDTAAIFLEPLQGEGGIHEISEKTWTDLCDLRRKHGFLIVVDEVQSGMFRTGNFLCCNKWKTHADLITLGKGLGGGLPLSACLVRQGLETIFQPGDHGSTFGGNPAACALGSKVLEIIVRDKLDRRVSRLGKIFTDKLNSCRERHPDLVLEVRGKGFMLGVELTNEKLATYLKEAFFQRKILVNITSDKVWRLLPNFRITEKQIEWLSECFEEILSAYQKA
ncbi:MAG: aminotransferase class III-fold pyridoxal phosphate-dependent enzyme [Candidatus Wallbacteria bacterium]|nr:aminotransferase class III-fold pyridoxal phosphate-dependent enzyme [Candidatus Wallbacteria bacterium]